MYYVKALVFESGRAGHSFAVKDRLIWKFVVERSAGGKGSTGVGGKAESTRRLYLGHPGRHPPRSIAESARAVLPSRSLSACYLTWLAHCPTNINYFINHPLYELFRQSLEYAILFNSRDNPATVSAVWEEYTRLDLTRGATNILSLLALS